MTINPFVTHDAGFREKIIGCRSDKQGVHVRVDTSMLQQDA